MTEPISYTTEEIAKLLKVSKLTVYELIKKGELPSYRVGKQIRVDSTDLEAYKQNARNEMNPATSLEPIQIQQQPDAHRPVVPIEEERLDQEGDIRSLIITGQDASLDLLAKAMERKNSRIRPLRSVVGSMDSLVAMYNGRADIVSTHLFDGDTGEYNLPFIRKLFISLPYKVIHLVTRKAGLYVKQGNTLNIHTWDDLARRDIRLVNREKGSGARVLLDEQLRLHGISPASISGYQNEEMTHMGVAGRIVMGQADVGVGSERPARIEGLEFIPLIQEKVDLVVLKQPENKKWIMQLQQILQSHEFQEELLSLGDYEVSLTGQVLAENGTE
ncbi:putative molybdopterin biosynthesis protein [Fontibacillus panacisegetis]|uniref:Putative molybdopterin biosynthesis protein n=1 Tax=Fontibacillus panacisegetis TaxID=670482 RepID=A0A1G7KC95_9BACL|nr:helix-turn-helix transcriptional regulator [Fontibacillus panacisegetis]SDF34815.1 putative molybdopterin biosynthesis protein [Fontibacillus panacisegetis]